MIPEPFPPPIKAVLLILVLLFVGLAAGSLMIDLGWLPEPQ